MLGLEQVIAQMDSQVVECFFAGQQCLIQDSFGPVFAPSHRIHTNIDFVLFHFNGTSIGVFQLLLPVVIMFRLDLPDLEACAQDKKIVVDLRLFVGFRNCYLLERLATQVSSTADDLPLFCVNRDRGEKIPEYNAIRPIVEGLQLSDLVFLNNLKMVSNKLDLPHVGPDNTAEVVLSNEQIDTPSAVH